MVILTTTELSDIFEQEIFRVDGSWLLCQSTNGEQKILSRPIHILVCLTPSTLALLLY